MATFERSADTDKIIEVLRGVNDEITYSELASRTRLSRTRCKQLLRTARKALMKDKIVFGVEIGVGLARLADGDKVHLAARRKRHIGREAHRGIKEIETIEQFDKLSGADQIMATTNRTIFSLMKQQARSPQTGKRELPK